MQTRRRVWVSAGVVLTTVVMTVSKLDAQVLREYVERRMTPTKQFLRSKDWILKAHISAHLERLQKMIRTYDALTGAT